MGNTEADKIYRSVVDATYDVVRGIGEKSFFDLDDLYTEYIKLDNSVKSEMVSKLIADFKKCLDIVEELPDKVNASKIYVYIMSFLIKATWDRDVYKSMISFVMNSYVFSKENKFFLYYRFVWYAFISHKIEDEESSRMKEELYSEIFHSYYKSIGEELTLIPKESRNENFVVVMISQIIDLTHGPTKTMLDRCYILQKVLKKRVFIINSAEFVSPYGAVTLFDSIAGTYVEDYSNVDEIGYKDARFSIFQCPNQMPQVGIIKEIVEVIKTEKPYFILTVGGNSILNDICSRMVPTLSMATVFSGRTMTKGTFQVIGRDITDGDKRWLQQNNLPEHHIMESLFTFSFKEQTHTFTRSDLGFPEDGFVTVLVGGRLNDEVDDECEAMLIKLAEQGIYVAILGAFERFDEVCEKSDAFKKHGINMGFRDDVLAIDEHCDLYINPRRVGGGTSVAEALYKGVPAVTFNFGDVGVTAGKEFHVDSYEDMYNTILKYANDKEYYDEMSAKAKLRGERLIDSEGEFVKIIEAMENSPGFF